MKKSIKIILRLFAKKHKVYDFNETTVLYNSPQNELFIALLKLKYNSLKYIKLDENKIVFGDFDKQQFISHKIPCLYFSCVFETKKSECVYKIKNKPSTYFLIKNNSSIVKENISNPKYLLPVIKTLGYNPVNEWVTGKKRYNLEREHKAFNFEIKILDKSELNFQKIIDCKSPKYHLDTPTIALWRIIFNSPLSEIFYFGESDNFKFCWFLKLSDRKILFQLGAVNGIGSVDFLYFNLKSQDSLIDFAQGESVYKTKLSNCEIDNFSFYI
jgi:hypothetical protein